MEYGNVTTVAVLVIGVLLAVYILYWLIDSGDKETLVTVNNHQFIPLPPGVEPGKYYTYNGFLWYIDNDPNVPGNYVRRPVFSPNSVEGGPPADLSNVVPAPLRTWDRSPNPGEVIRSNWDGTIAKFDNGSMRVFMHGDTWKQAGSPSATYNGNFNVGHLGIGAPFSLYTNGAMAGPFWKVTHEVI